MRNLIDKYNLDGLLISSYANIYYLTGYPGFSTNEHEAYILLTHKRNYLITDARYTQQVKQKVSSFTIFERNINNSLKNILEQISTEHNLLTIGFEADNLTVAEYKIIKNEFPKLKPVDLSLIRVIKSKYEIGLLKKLAE